MEKWESVTLSGYKQTRIDGDLIPYCTAFVIHPKGRIVVHGMSNEVKTYVDQRYPVHICKVSTYRKQKNTASSSQNEYDDATCCYRYPVHKHSNPDFLWTTPYTQGQVSTGWRAHGTCIQIDRVRKEYKHKPGFCLRYREPDNSRRTLRWNTVVRILTSRGHLIMQFRDFPKKWLPVYDQALLG